MVRVIYDCRKFSENLNKQTNTQSTAYETLMNLIELNKYKKKNINPGSS